MTNNRALSIFNQLRPVTVGFDNVFDHFERMIENDFKLSIPNFPPYNIVKTGKNTYDIELALAGYNKKDITIDLEEGILSIKSIKVEEKEMEEDGGILHKGIAKRHFSKSFTISDDVEVKGAELKDGLLKVSLERIVPEHKKPKTITIK